MQVLAAARPRGATAIDADGPGLRLHRRTSPSPVWLCLLSYSYRRWLWFQALDVRSPRHSNSNVPGSDPISVKLQSLFVSFLL